MKRLSPEAQDTMDKYLFNNLKTSLLIMCDLLPHIRYKDGSPASRRAFNKAWKFTHKMACDFKEIKKS